MTFYLDTSIFGGFFDQEFREDTIKLFDYINQEHVEVLYSGIIERELEKAPSKVRSLLAQLPNTRHVALNDKTITLANLYVIEGALTSKSYNDAQHIALATTEGASVVVSWNFKHMVNFLKIRQYNAINLREGYRTISIHTPTEIIIH